MNVCQRVFGSRISTDFSLVSNHRGHGTPSLLPSLVWRGDHLKWWRNTGETQRPIPRWSTENLRDEINFRYMVVKLLKASFFYEFLSLRHEFMTTSIRAWSFFCHIHFQSSLPFRRSCHSLLYFLLTGQPALSFLPPYFFCTFRVAYKLY